jgi:hypothetical protein
MPVHCEEIGFRVSNQPVLVDDDSSEASTARNNTELDIVMSTSIDIRNREKKFFTRPSTDYTSEDFSTHSNLERAISLVAAA